MIRIVKKPTDTPDDNSTGMVADALKKRGADFSYLDLDSIDLFSGDIENDLIWVCGIKQTGIHFDAISALNLRNRVVNSPEAIAICANKAQTTARLLRDNVPTPETIFTDSVEKVEEFLKKQKKVVYKPVYGYDGNGIYPMDDISMLGDSPYYIQEFIENICDYRVFVINGEAVGAIRRESDTFAHNIHQGGSGVPVFDIPKDMADIASRAALSVDIDYCGVDLLDYNGSYTVLEVNGTPNWHCMGVPIWDYLAEYLIELEKTI
jgi:ribosomal protein S6--L-glutamate ligase